MEWLPEYLFTEEIVEAAVESKKTEALSHIPGRFLTPGRIERITAGSMGSWHSSELRSTPEAYRSGAVCDYATHKRPKNITAVPEVMITREMVGAVIRNGRRDFDILTLIPERLWDAQLVYLVLRSCIYDPYYIDSRTDAVMKTGLILGYVPVEVKTQEFYYRMLGGMKILSTVTDTAVPSCFKTVAYYRKVAEYDLSFVPARFYSYETLHMTVCSTEGKNLITDPQFFKPLLVYLDDIPAGRLMGKHPYMFGRLPKRFKTPERPVTAIDSSRRETNCYTDGETEQSLLTVEVCKAFARRNGNCPEFPGNIWTREFVDYCIEYGTDPRWFHQMLRKSQSSTNTQAVYDYGHYHICNLVERLITPQMAKECYQERSYAHTIPGHPLTEFCRQTGLPEKFCGGETMMLLLRNGCDDYTHYKIGNTRLAFYLKEQYEPSSAHLMMTRSDPKYCTSEKVFDVPAGTFHRTWLEKIVAENDPRSAKPRMDKALKAVQAVYYYSVEKLKDLNHTEIFRSAFMGETIGYYARRRGLTYHGDSCRTLIESLKFGIRGMAVFVTLAENMAPYMINILHRKFGFCYIGMTAFVAGYGLDMEKVYTLAQIRQIVREKGHKPSLRDYKRELK